MKTVSMSKDDFQLIKSFYPEFKRAQGIQTNDYVIDWNELMPVVEKISLISTGEDDFYYPRTFGMRDADGNYLFRFNCFHLFTAKTLIEVTHAAVVDFIKWYTDNQQKP